MPRSVYHQSPGNPIQFRLLPKKRLQIEFAYHRAVDNDDSEFTFRVLKELLVASFVALMCCWALTLAQGVTLSIVLVAAATALVSWRVVQTHIAILRNASVVLTAVALVYHLLPLPFAVELYIALTASGLLAREVVRHFTFVATVTPVPLDKAWTIREAVNWQTLASSMLLIPFALCLVFPQHAPLLLATGTFGSVALAALSAKSPAQYVDAFREAIRSWCSYNRDDNAVPGILLSPSGRCSQRITMLLGVVLLNALLAFRLTGHVLAESATVGISATWHSGSLLELLFNVVSVVLPYSVVAVVPLGLVLFAVAIVGTPVFGRFAVPTPGIVAANEWKEITKRIRNSGNEDESESLYLGRISYDQSPLLVPERVFREHAHFLGDSGSGKTARGLSPLLEQIVSRGNASVMVLDLKGDSPELLQTLYQGAKTAKELAQNRMTVPVRYFTLREDQATYAFNPFRLKCWQQLNSLQRADILCGAMGLIYGSDYGEGYFSSANASVLYATISNFPTIGNFEELRDRIQHVITSPKRYGLDDKSRDAGNHVKMTVTKLATVAALNITEDCTPNAAAFEQRIDPTQLFQRPEALYFSLSATLGPGSSPEIARFATYMLLTTATLTRNRTPVYLVVDEFQRMASRNLDYLLQLARSMDVAVILANQSMEDLRSTGLVPTLETNCRYRQWFAVSGWDDQDRLSRASGETVDLLKSESVSRSQSERGQSTTTSRSRQEFIGPRLTKNDIKLVSDEDRKSIVLINRGAGYAQFGAMPVIVENDFHITAEEYKERRDADWPSRESGTFVAAEWERPQPEVPHRGRTQNTAPAISQETITLEPPPQQQKPKPPRKTHKKRRKNRRSRQEPDSRPKTATSGLFDRYLEDHPLESTAQTNVEAK